MKNKIHITLLSLVLISFTSKAQTLSESTFSAFSIDTDLLTGTGGEEGIFPMQSSYVLSAGLMEILQASDLDGGSVDNDKVPVMLAKVYTRNASLIVETTATYHLYVVNTTGNVLVNKEIYTNYEQTFPAGVYVVLLYNEKERDVYKVMIR